MRTKFSLLWVALVVLSACKDKKNWAERRQQELAAAKAEQAATETVPDAGPPAPSDPFWDDPSLIRISQDAACPEGLWALFPGRAPGADEAERKANEARRKELAQELRNARFVTSLRAPADVKLLEYDLRKADYPLEVKAIVECSDSIGHVAVAFANAKAGPPGLSAAQEGAEIQQNAWQAPPMPFRLPIPTAADAKQFEQRHRFDLGARIIYKLGRTDVDRKMYRQPKVKEGDIEMGGGMEDWGAGRMVRAQLEAVRVTKDRDATTLFDTRKETAKTR